MVVAFDKVNAFNLNQNEWPLYVERLEHILEASSIPVRDRGNQLQTVVQFSCSSETQRKSTLIWWTNLQNILPPLPPK